jgi:hypothetical protein
MQATCWRTSWLSLRALARRSFIPKSDTEHWLSTLQLVASFIEISQFIKYMCRIVLSSFWLPARRQRTFSGGYVFWIKFSVWTCMNMWSVHMIQMFMIALWNNSSWYLTTTRVFFFFMRFLPNTQISVLCLHVVYILWSISRLLKDVWKYLPVMWSISSMLCLVPWIYPIHFTLLYEVHSLRQYSVKDCFILCMYST